MNKGYSIFKNEAKELCCQNSAFSYIEAENGVPEIQGKVILRDEQGLVLDVYDVRIVSTQHYPLEFPLVYETGGRIPINVDWHMHSDGHCCICSILEEILTCQKGITLSSFIKGQVFPYFFNQKHRDIYGFFLNERPHGMLGNIEPFIEVFKTDNLLLIIKCLTYIRSEDEPKRTQKCFCGSGILYRKCHRSIYRLFKPLSTETLDDFIKFIVRYRQLRDRSKYNFKDSMANV